MFTHPNEIIDYYAAPDRMTNIGPAADLLVGLPADLPGLVSVVQDQLIHIFWAARYGRTLSDDERATVQVRPLAEKLARIAEVDPAPLIQPRPVGERQVGNCRDYSLFLCGLLRAQGVPARARCGFATYFLPQHYEDHWVCEVWHTQEARWVMVDAQLDALQQQVLAVDFDTFDVPPDHFIDAGRAYQMCRAGRADPEDFGIADMHGIDFIQGNVVRDFLALNKVEILPWDWGWGFLTPEKFADVAFFDRLAALTAAGDATFAELRALYESEPSLAVPA